MVRGDDDNFDDAWIKRSYRRYGFYIWKESKAEGVRNNLGAMLQEVSVIDSITVEEAMSYSAVIIRIL